MNIPQAYYYVTRAKRAGRSVTHYFVSRSFLGPFEQVNLMEFEAGLRLLTILEIELFQVERTPQPALA